MDLVGPPGAGTAGGLSRVKSPRAHADAARMATLLERLLRRTARRTETAAPKARAAEDADVDSIEKALALCRARPVVIDVDDALHEGGRFLGEKEYEDFLAEDIVGTFVLLRWVMDMQSDKEWYTSEEWRKRMRGIEMGYMQVELAIGLGVGKRKGHIKDNCDHKDSYLNRLGQKMHATPVECYQYRFHVDLSNVYPSLNHRNAIFPLLFCDRARYYLDLVQEQVRKTPPPRRPPAQTHSFPDGERPVVPAVCEH